MGKTKESWTSIGSYGEYVGPCCDNCHHFWNDGKNIGCDLGETLWDSQCLQNVEYSDDRCPNWISAYVIRHKEQPTLL
jgi:hypothetical protein